MAEPRADLSGTSLTGPLTLTVAEAASRSPIHTAIYARIKTWKPGGDSGYEVVAEDPTGTIRLFGGHFTVRGKGVTTLKRTGRQAFRLEVGPRKNGPGWAIDGVMSVPEWDYLGNVCWGLLQSRVSQPALQRELVLECRRTACGQLAWKPEWQWLREAIQQLAAVPG